MEAKGAGKDRDSSPGSRLPLRTPEAGITRGTRGPRPSPELHRGHFQPRNSPAFPGPPKIHKLPSRSCLQSRGWRGEPGPCRGRRAGHPRTHLPRVAPAAGSASARTAAGPPPVRSLLPAPPSPRPREVGPAAAPESRGGLPELSRALPPRLLGGWAGPTRPDVMRTTAGSSLLSSTPAPLPRPPPPREFLNGLNWMVAVSLRQQSNLTFVLCTQSWFRPLFRVAKCVATLITCPKCQVFLSTSQCNAKL